MKSVIAMLVLTVSAVAQASTFADPNLEAIAQLMPHRIPGIEKLIEQAVATSTQVGKLKQFSIKWDQTLCTLAGSSELSSQSGGTCIVTANAFQVNAKVGIIIGQGAPVVSVIYADVE